MRKEKGQDIIEYALMLAVVVGIGFGIYSYGGQGIVNSISSVFNNAGSLLDSASVPAASSPEDIIKRLGDGRYKGLADILQGKPASKVDIAFDSVEGKALAQKLNIQTKEGDGWYVRVNTDGFFIVSYYSAAAEGNNGVTFDQLRENYNSNSVTKTQIKIAEGKYYPDGTLKYYAYTAGHVDKSPDGNPDHVEKSPDGSNGMTIYPGDY